MPSFKEFCVTTVAFVPGFSVTAPWAFIWFLDGNENKVDISIMGTNGKCFLVNAHGVFRRMGVVTEIPSNIFRSRVLEQSDISFEDIAFQRLHMPCAHDIKKYQTIQREYVMMLKIILCRTYM